MTRATYGSRMADWEEEQDKRYWERRYLSAIDENDYEKVEELIKEALTFDYEIPSSSDPKVTKLLHKYNVI